MEDTTLEYIKELCNTNYSRCIQCGRCSANCPAAGHMDLLPSQMVWALINERTGEIMEADSPWKCFSCFTCAARCPRGVSAANIMEAVRLAHIRQVGANRLPAETIENFDPQMPQQAIVAAFRKFNK